MKSDNVAASVGCGVILIWLAFWIILIWIAVHFITKVW